MGWISSVWSWRLRMDTSFRAQGAKNLYEEFKAYGYPEWVFKLVGAVKTSLANMLVLAIIFPTVSKTLTLIGASGMCALMLVALVSHAKVGDPLAKSVPAAAMLTCNVYLLYAVSAGCVYDSPAWGPPADPVRVGFGVLVELTCFAMWARSFKNSDYNLDDYGKLGGNLLNA